MWIKDFSFSCLFAEKYTHNEFSHALSKVLDYVIKDSLKN